MRALTWVSTVVFIATLLCKPIADPDIWWHLNVGRWIVANREVPNVDYWNMFAVGYPWRAYSWSNEVLYAVIYSLWGDVGLASAQLLLAGALVVILALVLGRFADNMFIGLLLAFLSSVGISPLFSLRPQTTVWILFVFVLFIAENCRRGDSPKRGQLVSMFLIGIAWANSHLSAILGLFAATIWPISSPTLLRDLRLKVLPLGLAFLFGTLISPYLGGEWLTLFHKSDHVFLFRSIDEFAPGDLTRAPTEGLLLLIALLISLCLSSSGRLPHLGGVLVAICTSVAAGLALKFTAFGLISVAALIAIFFGDLVAPNKHEQCERNKIFEGVLALNRRVLGLESQTLGAVVFFIGVLSFVNLRLLLGKPVNYDAVPKVALDMIDQNGLAHPVLNEFGTGGYLQFRWSSERGEPRHTVAIDGRTNVNPKEIWDAYMSAYWGREDWRGYLDKVKARTVVWRRGRPLFALLVEDPKWCLVFERGKDVDSFVVFVDRAQFDDLTKRGVVSKASSPDCAG